MPKPSITKTLTTNVKVELTEDEVLEIIAEAVQKKTGFQFSAGDVSLDISSSGFLRGCTLERSSEETVE